MKNIGAGMVWFSYAAIIIAIVLRTEIRGFILLMSVVGGVGAWFATLIMLED